MLPLSLIVVLSYLVGSIPTSLLISKAVKGIDIRKYGSGNAGGTNVARVFGWQLGGLVTVLDGAKGLIATQLIARLMYGPIPFNNRTPFEDFTIIQIIAGAAAVLGHVWTIFAGFRGGKGIATATGLMVGIAPIELGISAGVFALVLLISRYVSLSSLCGATAFPFTMFVRANVFHANIEGYNTLIFLSLGVAAFLIFTHRENIKRLLKGTEKKMTLLREIRRRHRTERAAR
ncbi:MAG: glycerol-3-phosphate 1-O-acyltransferase PlsY [Bacteroidota bacterium]